jgi:methylmalonyl-CoA/ethylmalonyl-CoA epimerase
MIMARKWALLVVAGLLLIGQPYGQEDLPKENIIGSRVVVQIGIVVKDIERSSRAYAELLGIDVPRWEMTDPVELSHTRYLGRPSEARAKLAFFQLKNIVIELIEPVGGPSTWKDFLDAKGEGVHHIACEVTGMDKRVADLKARGVPLIQQGDYTGGRYSYLDGVPKLGVILELLENFSGKTSGGGER